MFFESGQRARAGERGVVLILILGMLALMALIGVTFATFAGQSLVNSRNFGQSVNFPTSEQVMDYALAQLINDTNNPTSALRGHSLLRDMYGNDSVMKGNAAASRCLLSRLPDGTPLKFTAWQFYGNGTVPANRPFDYYAPAYGLKYVQYTTNIPVSSYYPALYNLDFTHWLLKIPSGSPNVSYPHNLAQTYEVIEDDATGAYHVLTLSMSDPNDLSDLATGLTGLPITRIYRSADTPYLYGDTSHAAGPQKAPMVMNQAPPGEPSASVDASYPGVTSGFILDGRHMRAFNGTGMTFANNLGAHLGLIFNGSDHPRNNAAYANFRVNGNLIQYPFNPTSPAMVASNFTKPAFGDPDAIAMDEDYDACDLENWYLALQSADGGVMIPSFHRPGILTRQDWYNVINGSNAANDIAAVMSVSKILRPRKIDNDTLHFPDDPVPDLNGKIKFDVDNDGDGATDSVWLDLGYPSLRDPRGQTFKPLFAFMVIGLNGRIPLNTAGNLQSRDFQLYSADAGTPFGSSNHDFAPDNVRDGATWGHASHLGYSVNEISPLFALQNAPNTLYGPSGSVSAGGFYSQHDNSGLGPLQSANGTGPGLGVDLIQLRNILAGTYPQDNLTSTTGANNNDANFVAVNGTPYYLPNSVADASDVNFPGGPITRNGVAPVPGRWGEVNGIPTTLTIPPYQQVSRANSRTVGYSGVYTNPVRAGRSVQQSITGGWLTSDAMDDDADAFDFYPTPPPPTNPFPNPNPSNGEGYYNNTGVPPIGFGDYYDPADTSVQLPVERLRRFVTPIDPSGAGRTVAWNERPANAWDYGQGYDNWGRAGFFRYFRPAGVPKTVTYDTTTTTLTPFAASQRFNEPILTTIALPDRTNNLLHGWQSAAMPIGGIGASAGLPPASGIAVMAAMPYDMASGAPLTAYLYPPTINTTTVPGGTMSTQVNTAQGPLLPSTDPDYIATASVANTYPNWPTFVPGSSPPVPLPSASLNKDEADEMNLYTSSLVDLPYGPSDLEWLYRKQDVDGASLSSRLSQLAPVSFLNPADGTMRRRLFSTDSAEMITYASGPDNPLPINALSQDFLWNSRYAPFALNPTSGLLAQTVSPAPWMLNYNRNPGGSYFPTGENPNLRATGFSYPTLNPNALNQYPNPITYPPGTMPTAFPYTPSSSFVTNNQFAPTFTPSVAHRDRKINLNYPLPVSNDTTEPVRQKWVRETYEYFKMILPPMAVDTPAELAAVPSQFVVNIVDFRDPDCTATRFVNTDLMVTPATATNPSAVTWAKNPVPVSTSSPAHFVHYAFDPLIYDQQIKTPQDADWTSQMPSTGETFLVQHGMEYNPLALNEVLAYAYTAKIGGSAQLLSRMAIELVNTLTDDAAPGNNSDLGSAELRGWDLVLAPDNNAQGRPDPTTGELSAAGAALLNVSATFDTAGSSSIVIPATARISALRAGGPAGGRAYFNLATPPPVGLTPADAFPANDGTLPATFIPPTPAINETKWFWLYLRRPANPFVSDPSVATLPPTANREMVVVDSIRFSYSRGGVGTVGTMGMPDTVSTPGTAAHFSAQRLQPYRGGHRVPSLGAGNAPVPAYAWGYSEQTVVTSNTAATNTNPKFGTASASPQIATTINHTIGAQNADVNNKRDTPWDLLPFNDRDFQNVAELLLVPNCPPGLFTKQFVEENYPTGRPLGNGYVDTPPPGMAADPSGNDVGRPFVTGTPSTPHSFPYLADEFFYTAASPHPAPGGTPAYYAAGNQVGGWTGDGWHKMLEYVEVPSSALGAIGQVASGNNFDWYRQDTKPGLLNLNLIIDEEVFFGLFDDLRLNGYPANTNNSFLPQVVTEIDTNGYPSYPHDPALPGIAPALGKGYHDMSPIPFGRGFTSIQVDAVTGVATETAAMKAAFSDFLKIRAGGSGYLFAWGSGLTGSGPFSGIQPSPPTPQSTPIQNPPASERPFRSLSYPDIDYTVMRPATLPPSVFTTDPTLYTVFSPPYQLDKVTGAPTNDKSTYTAQVVPPATPFVGDPGVRNPLLPYPGERYVPPIPLRRLFQVPDAANSTTPASGSSELLATSTFITNPPVLYTDLTTTLADSTSRTGNLFSPYKGVITPGAGAAGALGTPAGVAKVNHYLGAGLTGGNDNRQHPYYRTEMLQKVMNLTTVRTHQFAVWITVGFFEVLKPGTASHGIPDFLGGELGLAAGRNIRYRSFFLLDRTRAVGFNPSSPIDFRDVITYRRRIE